ncbi:MAG: NBR1-Ig-like domain-containing protein [Chloroflexota bacterium]
MHKRFLRLFFPVLFLVFSLACNLSSPKAPDAAATLNPLYTAAARTVEAMNTQAAGTALASPTLSPGTATPPLSFSSLTPYQSPAPVSRCDAAAFIKDVTIPDGTVIERGDAFQKIWRLQNVGTCSWTPSYALVFISGDGMSGPTSASLPGNVNPGESMDLSVNLTAPGKDGHYRGYWKLRNPTGALFGIGAQADTAFWVDVNVSGPEYAAYDFVAKACEAEWKSRSGGLSCPGDDGSDEGYVLELSKPRMENGVKENQPGLLTVPNHKANGYIQGKYPFFKVQPGDHFKADINCQYGATTCDVLFRLEYRIDDGDIKILKEWHEVYEGEYYPVDLDLGSLAGKNVRFFLTVSANDSKGEDEALWLAPRIVRQGAPP